MIAAGPVAACAIADGGARAGPGGWALSMSGRQKARTVCVPRPQGQRLLVRKP